jgi:hypothetical protein
METIKIKRATMTGLKEAEGELMEAHGLQFCFTKTEEGLYFLIELSSGGSVLTVDSDDFTKKEAREIMKNALQTKQLSDFQKAISKFTKRSKRMFGIPFPVNEPVLSEKISRKKK